MASKKEVDLFGEALKRDETLERAKCYYTKTRYEIGHYINLAMCDYDHLMQEVKEGCGSDAQHPSRQAMTKPEQILLLLALTREEYEALKALPRDQLPLLINKTWVYPDQEVLFQKRLKNG